jgi:hypothetical protein
MSTHPAYNPQLKAWQRHQPSGEPGAGRIEQPGAWQNIVWQTRSREPNVFEQQLIQALEQVFASGAQELDDVVAQLNHIGMNDENGQPWTPASFERAMAVLGY